MKTDRNILIAFLLNLCFCVAEFIGGALIGSVAIASDALHDLGDALSLGIAYVLERISKRKPDAVHTYGYIRYSVLGSLITTAILLVGSVAILISAVGRIISPAPIHYDGMILFAVVGIAVNLIAAFVTAKGESLNQKAVNLHMLEDVLGWAVVLVGAIVMRFTDFALLDPILSICVAAFILSHAVHNLKDTLNIFLEKSPLSTLQLREHLMALEGIEDVHHIHIWTLDGQTHCATLHAVTAEDPHSIKDSIRHELTHLGVGHVTIELEVPGEHCHAPICHPEPTHSHHHHHHHHHH